MGKDANLMYHILDILDFIFGQVTAMFMCGCVWLEVKSFIVFPKNPGPTFEVKYLVLSFCMCDICPTVSLPCISTLVAGLKENETIDLLSRSAVKSKQLAQSNG